MLAGEAIVMHAGLKEQETAFAGLLKSWKDWGVRRDPTVGTHAGFMDMLFNRSYKDVAYKSQLSALVTQLRSDIVVSEVSSLDLWCVTTDLREERFVDSHVPGAKDIEFKTRFGQYQEECRQMFVG